MTGTLVEVNLSIYNLSELINIGNKQMLQYAVLNRESSKVLMYGSVPHNDVHDSVYLTMSVDGSLSISLINDVVTRNAHGSVELYHLLDGDLLPNRFVNELVGSVKSTYCTSLSTHVLVESGIGGSTYSYISSDGTYTKEHGVISKSAENLSILSPNLIIYAPAEHTGLDGNVIRDINTMDTRGYLKGTPPRCVYTDMDNTLFYKSVDDAHHLLIYANGGGVDDYTILGIPSEIQDRVSSMVISPVRGGVKIHALVSKPLRDGTVDIEIHSMVGKLTGGECIVNGKSMVLYSGNIEFDSALDHVVSVEIMEGF